jgi:predicted methyltransferase
MTRMPALSVLFSQAKEGDRIADAMSGDGSFTRILRGVEGTSGHVVAYIPTATIRLMVLAGMGELNEGAQIIEQGGS